MKQKEIIENTFSLIKERYFQIDKDFDKLEYACKNEDEMKQLKQDYIIARANYRLTLNLNFEENNADVKELTEKLAKVEERISNDIKNIGITSSIFGMITESVNIASSIIVLIMSLV